MGGWLMDDDQTPDVNERGRADVVMRRRAEDARMRDAISQLAQVAPETAAIVERWSRRWPLSR